MNTLHGVNQATSQAALDEGLAWVVPSFEADIPADLPLDEQIMALRGLSRRQAAFAELRQEEDYATIDALAETVVERDHQITVLRQERDHFEQLSAQSNFGELLNKVTFRSRATAVVEGDQREETKHLSKIVGFIDVDDLDILNSYFTETVIDIEVLEKIAEILHQEKRNQDLASNWGGDEFAELLVGLQNEDASTYFERIRTAINAIRINPAFAGAEETAVSVCIGYAEAQTGDTYIQTEAKAARAKEYAKELSGKNNIVNYADVPIDWVPTRKARVS